MAITTYTSYDTIRAILGVSAKEIKDATLGLPLFETQFLLEMGDVDQGGGAVISQYNTIAALTPSARTAQQQQLLNLVNMLAAYSVGRQILTGAALAIPVRVTDGKAELERFDTQNFDKVREGVLLSYGQVLRRLKAVIVALVPSAQVLDNTARTHILSAGLASDPVTGQ